jgi:hypothetical protein
MLSQAASRTAAALASLSDAVPDGAAGGPSFAAISSSAAAIAAESDDMHPAPLEESHAFRERAARPDEWLFSTLPLSEERLSSVAAAAQQACVHSLHAREMQRVAVCSRVVAAEAGVDTVAARWREARLLPSATRADWLFGGLSMHERWPAAPDAHEHERDAAYGHEPWQVLLQTSQSDAQAMRELARYSEAVHMAIAHPPAAALRATALDAALAMELSTWRLVQLLALLPAPCPAVTDEDLQQRIDAVRDGARFAGAMHGLSATRAMMRAHDHRRAIAVCRWLEFGAEDAVWGAPGVAPFMARTQRTAQYRHVNCDAIFGRAADLNEDDMHEAEEVWIFIWKVRDSPSADAR